MQTGQKIKHLRKQAGLSQEELASECFVSRELVSKWETGERRPDYGSLLRLCEVFKTDIESISDRNEELLSELAECLPENREITGENIGPALSAFLRSVSEKERNVFIRRYYFCEDAAQIGGMYKIKPGSVRMILMRTRKKLFKFLSEENNGRF